MYLRLTGIILLLAGVVTFLATTDVAQHNSQLSARAPLPATAQRPQLLRFGMYVTPDPGQNPISPPERFTGYHTALDIEIHPDEANETIPVMAVCDGSVAQATTAQGYGGILVQRCTFNQQEATVIYGHLDPDSLVAEGTQLTNGQQLGILAEANSPESGHTRKHLHLGIHKGSEIDIRGYVETEEELTEFIDPKEVLDI